MAFQSYQGIPKDSTANALYGVANSRLNFTKYGRYGERSGLASIQDAEIIKRRIKQEKENAGTGFVRYQMVDSDGRAIKQTDIPMNVDGRMCFPDKDGIYTIIDEGPIKEAVKRINERIEYVEDIIMDASKADEICAHYLGVDDCSKFLGPDNDGGVVDSKGKSMSAELIKVDATPSSLQCLDHTTPEYARALRKFRFIFFNRCPTIQNMTSKQVLEKGVE